MNKTQISKDIKKNQGAAEKSGDGTTAVELQATTAPAGSEKGAALDIALDGMNASDLGMSILDELHTLFKTIEASAQVGDITQDEMRARLRTIERFARLAAHFADERTETFSFYRDQAHEVVAALRAAS